MLRIGITSRITKASGYFEQRDSLAHDWGDFFKREFPNELWVSIPNLGKDALNYFNSLSLNVLILSGGDSLGETLKRDETEYTLLDYAIKNSIPVVAICRGMQLVHTYFGGRVVKGDQKFVSTHRAKEHDVIFEDGKILSLNSYHNNIIIEKTIHQSLSVIARCKEDFSVEAFAREGLIALMWHPEREMKDKNLSTKLIKNFLLKT